MAKRRLLEWMRCKLVAHAREVVAPIKEKKELDSAYEKASTLVRSMLLTKYPPKEMVVLKKFGFGGFVCSIKVQFPNGVVDKFEFEEDDAIFIASSYGQIHAVNQKTADAIERWSRVKATFTKERDKRVAAYKALVDGSRYVEDIVAVWPEAVYIIPPTALPIPLGPEQIAMVKQDMLERSVVGAA